MKDLPLLTRSLVLAPKNHMIKSVMNAICESMHSKSSESIRCEELRLAFGGSDRQIDFFKQALAHGKIIIE